MNNKDKFKMDRSVLSITSLDKQDKEDDRYWSSKTYRERLEAVEMTRQIIYGYDPATARLQRVLEIIERS